MKTQSHRPPTKALYKDVTINKGAKIYKEIDNEGQISENGLR